MMNFEILSQEWIRQEETDSQLPGGIFASFLNKFRQ